MQPRQNPGWESAQLALMVTASPGVTSMCVVGAALSSMLLRVTASTDAFGSGGSACAALGTAMSRIGHDHDRS